MGEETGGGFHKPVYFPVKERDSNVDCEQISGGLAFAFVKAKKSNSSDRYCVIL